MTYFKWKKLSWKVNIHGVGALLKGSFVKPSGVGQEHFDCQTKCEVRRGSHAVLKAGDLEPPPQVVTGRIPTNRESTRQACTEEPLANNKLLRTGHANWGRLNVLSPGASNTPNPQMILLNQLG